MSEEKTKWLYYIAGDDIPKVLPAIFEYKDSDNWHCSIGQNWSKRVNRRWKVTDAEYRAYYGIKAWESATGHGCPDGYEVVDFRLPEVGEIILWKDGSAIDVGFPTCYLSPILKKLKPVRDPIGPDTVLTKDMELRGGFSWNRVDASVGHTVAKAYRKGYEHMDKITVRYIDDESSEYTYIKPIEWVTPTDDDAMHRPKVGFSANGTSWLSPFTLVYVTKDNHFIGGNGSMYRYCRMDKSLRKEWA
jgi:hypothetical protein